MSTLTNTQIRNTYDALLKLADNGNLTTVLKEITDGLGNVTPLSISQIAIKSSVDIEASGFKTPTGTSSQFLKADGSIDSTIYTGDQDLSGYALTSSIPSGNQIIDWTVDNGATVIHSGNYTDTTYVSSDFTHNSLTGVSADEHIDWTLTNAKNIHSDNYTDTIYDSTSVDTHIANVTTNPHNVTKTNVGLGNVDNTSDANKPVSTATQTALNGKVDDSQVLTNVPSGALFTDTIYTHPSGDGNLHVIATLTTNNGKVLTAGATAGSLTWTDKTVNTTYTSSDFTHNDLSGVSANEHIDWTGASTGTIHITNLPATAITSVQIASTQVAMLALTTQEGDVVVRSDENQTYMHNGGTAGTMADFTELATPTSDVTSVDGATGAVVLNHDTLAGFVSNEHIDWTADNGATNIHAGNYTNTTYTNVSEFTNDAGYTGDQDLSGYSLTSHNHTFASLTSKPTTILGYGITDGIVTTDARLSDARTATLTGNLLTAVPVGALFTDTTYDLSTYALLTDITGTNSGTNTGDQDLSGYLLNTSDTLNGTLSIAGNLNVTGNFFSYINGSSLALQRMDTRLDATNYSRSHWYGINDTGGTSNFRHAWYTGAGYINVTAESGGVTFGGNLVATNLSGTNTGDQDLSGYLLNTTDTFTGTLTVIGSISQGALYYQDVGAGRIGFNRNTSNGAIHDTNYNAFQLNGAETSGVNGKFELQAYSSAGVYGGSLSFDKNANLTVTGALEIGSNNTSLNGRTSGGVLVGMLKVDQFNNTQLGDSGGTYALELIGSSFLYTGGNATFAGTTTVQGTGDSSFVGNVGIGTDSPNANLDILNGTTGASLKLSATATAYWQLQRDSITGNLNISDDALGNVMSFDQLTGNVGIGTDSPDAKLEILKSGTNTFPTLGTADGNLYLTDGGLWGMFMGVDSSSGTGWIQQMRNDSAVAYDISLNPVGGNVGIGTASPGQKLTVSEAGNGNIALFTNTTDADLNINLTSGVTMLTPSTGILAFGTSSTEKMRIDSDGNVGIGTASPNSTLSVGSTDGGAVITAGGTNTHLTLNAMGAQGALIFGAGGVANGVQGTERMRIKSDGNVGIGTDSPNAKLDLVGGDITGGLKISEDKTNSAFFAFGADSNETRITSSSYGGFKPLTIHTGGAERMRITSGGDVTMTGDLDVAGRSSINGYTDIGYALSVGVTTLGNYSIHTTGRIFGDTDVSGLYAVGRTGLIGGRNSITTTYALDILGVSNLEGALTVIGNVTATDFVLSSDIRLKKDLLPLYSKRLSPSRWTWKDSGKKDFGFIAQELEVDFPEVVVTGEDGFKKVAYNKITAINSARVNELEDEVLELKRKLELIMQKLDI